MCCIILQLKGSKMAKRTTDSDTTNHQARTELMSANSLRSAERGARDNRVMDSIRHIDARFDSERQVIGAIARNIMVTQGYLTNKDIILRLISHLEVASDVVEQDILRNALELVLGVTPDDE